MVFLDLLLRFHRCRVKARLLDCVSCERRGYRCDLEDKRVTLLAMGYCTCIFFQPFGGIVSLPVLLVLP